jgi:tetraacyldisaccharide 4'-kinase
MKHQLLSKVLNRLWYTKHPVRWMLYPLSCVYRVVARVRCVVVTRWVQKPLPVPVIVVGNLTVGGVGKTPLVIAITQYLEARGVRVGIVSRGYGARITTFPHEVRLDNTSDDVGDEPLLLAEATGVPVVIAPKRVEAVQYLCDTHQVDVVISDDGLQHDAMARAVEIVVVDGKRGFGNGLCLPAGPLRESKKRLKSVDFVVVNGEHGGSDWPDTYRMDMLPGNITALATGDVMPQGLAGDVAAVAGIGHPERFFDTLTTLGIRYQSYIFPDHHRFKPEDLDVAEATVVMTEKDAVKCRAFADNTMYVLPVRAKLHDDFWERLGAHERL